MYNVMRCEAMKAKIDDDNLREHMLKINNEMPWKARYGKQQKASK